jgi:ABC-type uncharacterized transport system permease subunit
VATQVKVGSTLTSKLLVGILTPVVAFILALIVGGVIILVFITSYQLTDQAFEKLSREGIPAELLQKLEPLKNRNYHVQEEFVNAVKVAIGEQPYQQYHTLLLKHAFVREDPLSVYKTIFSVSMGNRAGWGEVFYRATPLIFTGLAVAFGFQCGLFNIGGEGQMVIGAFAMTWVCFTFTGLPSFILIPFAILVGAAGGAIWGGVPGYLKAKLGVHEVVNTIMMNWIAVALVQYLTMAYKEQGDMIPQTKEIAKSAWLSRLYTYFNALGIKFPQHIHLNTSIVVALLAVVILAYILKRTKLGYEIRAVGFNPAAAECAGISVAKNTILAMAISGAVAGLVGVNQVMGDKHRFLYEIFDGKGFDGIGVALIGKNHPFGVVLGALLFGILEFGGFSASVQSGGKVPREIIMILKAIILIFFVVSGEITKRIMIFLQKRKGGQAA